MASEWMKAPGWPRRRLREGYRVQDLPALAAARLRGLSPQGWEEEERARETEAQAEVLRTTPRTLFLEITGRCPIEGLMCARRYRNWTSGDLKEGVFEKREGVWFFRPWSGGKYFFRRRRILG